MNLDLDPELINTVGEPLTLARAMRNHPVILLKARAVPFKDLPGCEACVPCPACGPTPTEVVITYRYWWQPTSGDGRWGHIEELRLCAACLDFEMGQLIRPDARRLAEICSVEILMIENGEGG